MKKNDLMAVRSIHFVGIKGIAMASLAVWAHEKGVKVTGSDVKEEFPSDPILKRIGVRVLLGFNLKHIENQDLIVYTGAHGGKDNIEVVEAIRKGIPVLPHGKALGMVMQGKRQLSVAGSHGKTTTSAMIATIMMRAGTDPSYAIGCGEIRGLGLPGHYGKGEYFIAEADEYITDPMHDTTPRFLWQRPDILVVTNIDYDHPDAYASLSAIQKAFSDLVKQQKGRKLVIVNADDPASKPLIQQLMSSRVVTFGLLNKAHYFGTNIVFHAGHTTFDIICDNTSVGTFTLKVPGRHNVGNAIAACVACRECGISWKKIQEGIESFQGAKRRFDLITEFNGVSYYDDYAHHPREIAATLAAVRSWYPNQRIIVVFQPHTYSRTKSLLSDFAVSFAHSDIVIPCEIYSSARETDSLGMTGVHLAHEIEKNHPHVLFAKDTDDVVVILAKTIQRGDKVIFMGAGDIYTWEKYVIKKIKKI